MQSLCCFTQSMASRQIRRLKAQGNLQNIGKPTQPIYIPTPGHYEKWLQQVWEISQIKVYLRIKLWEIPILKVFLIAYFINYLLFKSNLWEYEKWISYFRRRQFNFRPTISLYFLFEHWNSHQSWKVFVNPFQMVGNSVCHLSVAELLPQYHSV